MTLVDSKQQQLVVERVILSLLVIEAILHVAQLIGSPSSNPMRDILLMAMLTSVTLFFFYLNRIGKSQLVAYSVCILLQIFVSYYYVLNVKLGDFNALILVMGGLILVLWMVGLLISRQAIIFFVLVDTVIVGISHLIYVDVFIIGQIKSLVQLPVLWLFGGIAWYTFQYLGEQQGYVNELVTKSKRELLEKQYQNDTLRTKDEVEEIQFDETEKEVFQLVVQGITYKQIAKELSISERTVYNKIRKVCDKFGVVTPIEAAVYAAKKEII